MENYSYVVTKGCAMGIRKGVFIISLDTEMAWGWVEKSKNLVLKMTNGEDVRDIIDFLLSLFEDAGIAATWAIVGHLFLDSCQLVVGRKHPEIIRPKYLWLKHDWFLNDPCSSLSSDGLWYGKDIVEKIKNCRIPQDIGCHTFSHILLGDNRCDEKCVHSDLQKCMTLAEGMDINLRSFVAPRGSNGHLHILRDYGFTSFRGGITQWHNALPFRQLRRLLNFVNEIIQLTPPTVFPSEKDGLMKIPGSMSLSSNHGIRKVIPISWRFNRAKKGIDRAVSKNGIFHLILHPHSLAWKGNMPLKILFEDIIRYAVHMRDKGVLDIKSMKQVTEKN